MAITKAKLIADGVITVDNLNASHGIQTTHISEGTNLYYTDARVGSYLTANNYITTAGGYFSDASLSANILTFQKSDGTTDTIDLSLYLDDTNLARLVSGTLDGQTGIATFTRDDSSTFTIDFSAFLADANDYVSSGSFNTNTGVLTLTRLGGGTVTVDLDGKYAEASHTHLWADITDAPTALSFFTNDSGFLTSFTETDPVYVASSWYTTTNNAGDWDTAYGWGDHSLAGYLTSFTETDPVFTASAASGITSTQITNWDAAYGWGNHASAGYLTSFSETDTLASVTARGSATTSAITTGLLITQGPGGNYDENIRLPGSTSVISFNTSGASGAGSYNIVSQTNFQIRNAGGSQIFVMDQPGNLTMASSLRAPIFYDSNDTAFYTDPASGTNFRYLNVDGTWGSSPFGSGHAQLNVTGSYASITQRSTIGALAYALHHIDDRYSLYVGRGATNGSDWGWALRAYPIQDDNYVEFRTSARAPIFYEKDNTGYYVDPASTSNLAGLNVANTITGSVSGRSGYSGYLETSYAGGVQSNPQVYFNNYVGLKAAMTGHWSVWSDTLWINGYAGGDVPNMCALHFLRNGTPRMAISSQSNTSSSYGTIYELWSSYNMDAPNRSGTSYYQVNTWLQLNGVLGLYAPSYNSAHFYPNNLSYGAWRIDGERNTWGGIHFGQGMTLMIKNTECGFHREGDGWYIYSANKNLYSPGDVTAYWSDRRLKKNIKPINNGLEKILALVPSEFEWNEKASKINENLYDGKHEVSLIAQEVQQIIPDAVTENLSAEGDDEEKYLTIKYDKITPYLIQAIKDQQKQIDELKKLLNL